MAIVFFYTGRPGYKVGPPTLERKSLDLLPAMREARKAFMPWLLWNETVKDGGFSDYPADIAPIEDRLCKRGKSWGWDKDEVDDPARDHSKAANLIRDVDRNASQDKWVVIPRMREGKCYIARIVSKYQIWARTNPWFQCLEERLKHDNLEPFRRYAILADAAQGWDTTAWVEVSLLALPRWFWIQTNAVYSFNRIHPRLGQPHPEIIAANAYENPMGRARITQAPNQRELERRFVQCLSPDALEFLCVELLNLSAHEGCALWMRVGKEGDGGVDGIGFDVNGQPKAFLSVKWQIVESEKICDPGANGESSLVVAYLLGTPPPKKDNWTLWDPTHIAALAWQHRERLSKSFAILLGINS